MRLVAMRRRQVQRKASRADASGAKIPTGGGSPLAADIRNGMEAQLGADLSSVRVHTGSDSATAAEEFGARAFTVGRDVHFGGGQFTPGTKEGDRLLAHELTHTVQTQRSGVQRKAAHDADSTEHGEGEHEVSQPGEPAEQEADHVADGVAERLHGDAHDGKAAGGALPEAGGQAKNAAPPPIAATPPGIGRKVIFRAASTATAPAKKPGLFGRMFGGGKKTPPRQPAAAAEQVDPLVKNVRELLDRPIPPDTKKELDKQYQALEKAAAELRTALAGADPALVKKAEAEVDAIRISASGTAQGKHGAAIGGGDAAKLARENFQKASQMVSGWAKAGVQISIEGLQKVNEALGKGLDNNGGTPGEVRKQDVMTMTATGAPNPYLPSKTVPGELVAAVAWYQANRTKLKGPALAAQMYQRLVSIHPFMDANGRTCRLAMDWVLESHGLPPAALQGDEVNVAVFGLDKIAGRSSVAPGHAEQAVVAGIQRTIDVMKRVIREAK